VRSEIRISATRREEDCKSKTATVTKFKSEVFIVVFPEDELNMYACSSSQIEACYALPIFLFC
jgi:hypothetical protein